jgi:Flp pilus assembly protein TadD
MIAHVRGKSMKAKSRKCNIQCITICITLLAFIAIVYGPLAGYDFVNIDDDLYTYKNKIVKDGLTSHGIAWALQTVYNANWLPLTWISYMIDVELFGTGPSGHHVVNVLLHAASVVLLFLVLRAMTTTVWPSAVVAALFAVHPLHVESVAWISERKDVLSAFFWMVTLCAYCFYVRKPGAARYSGIVAAFVLGLMSKAMLVTLPFVLLLLDYWPLRRIQTRFSAVTETNVTNALLPVRRLILEKLPLLGISIVVATITFHAQANDGAVGTLESFPIWTRIANAAVAYVSYLGKMLCPAKLAIFYPHPGAPPVWLAVGAVIILAAISLAVFMTARRHPYGIVGWLWYLGTLFPVSGLFQVGNQSMADRYTYLPLIGIYIVVAWTAVEIAVRRPFAAKILAAGGGVAILALSVTASQQVKHWRNTETLMQHALAVTEGNWLAHNNLGNWYLRSKRFEEAQKHYAQALQVKPDYGLGLSNMGLALYEQGEYEEAIASLKKALNVQPDALQFHANIAAAYSRNSQFDEAIAHYNRVLEMHPDNAWAHHDIANVYSSIGDTAQALVHHREAVRISPNYAEAHNGIGKCQESLGRHDEALGAYREALRIWPDYTEAENNHEKLSETHLR